MAVFTDEQYQKMMNERKKTQDAERQKKESCAACNARIDREKRMNRACEDILRIVRENRIVKLDSCMLCVKKHVARAMVYADELHYASGSGTADGTASVNIPMNVLKIIGHLGCAIEESEDFPEINAALVKAERQFRYEGVIPQWESICALTETVDKKHID